MKNFTEYGYNGANFSEAMKAALAAEPEVYIPGGNYTLTEPLIIPSRRKIAAAADAVIKAADGRFADGDYRATPFCSVGNNRNSVHDNQEYV